MTDAEWLAAGTRHLCITEKLKFGRMAAVYFHFDVADDGRVINKQMSVPGRYENKDVGALLDAIAARINSDTVPEDPAT